jgi:hypothetical protein
VTRKPGTKAKSKMIAGPNVVEDGIAKVAGVLVHREADRFPLMSEPDLDKLAADIKLNGLQDPVEYMRGKDGVLRMLDGRNRVRALELIAKAEGRELERDANGLPKIKHVIIDEKEIVNPVTYVLSRNLHRRHLTGEQRHDVIRQVALEHPEYSIRKLAEVTATPRSTVHGALQKTVEQHAEHVAEQHADADQGSQEASETSADLAGVRDRTPAQPEQQRSKGLDGKFYPKKTQKRKKQPGQKPANNAKTLTRDQVVVAVGQELAKKPREMTWSFIKLMEDSRGTLLKLSEPFRVEMARIFAAALGLGVDDLVAQQGAAEKAA